MAPLQNSQHAIDSNLYSFTWEAFCQLLNHSSSTVRDLENTTDMPPWLMSPGQYFFEANPQKHAIEELCLKLSILRVVCSLVADEHECNCRAYGVIGPEQVLVQYPKRHTTILPIRWGAIPSLAIGHRETSLSFDTMPEEMAMTLSSMPFAVNSPFAAPSIQEWPLGKRISVTALIQSVDPIPDDERASTRGLVRVHVIAEGVHARDFSNRDVFHVTLSIKESREITVELWARKVDTPERGIIVSGITNPLSSKSWNQFACTVGDVRSAAEIGVYRAFSPAHDAYSCGMLLLRALFGADEQRWRRVCEGLSPILESLEPIVQGVAEDDHYTLHVRIKDRLRESAEYYEPALVPEMLWWDALVIVLRACSRIRGFSYASEPTPYEPSPVRRLSRDLASLARRTWIELCETRERNAMIMRVCDRAVNQIGVAG